MASSALEWADFKPELRKRCPIELQRLGLISRRVEARYRAIGLLG